MPGITPVYPSASPRYRRVHDYHVINITLKLFHSPRCRRGVFALQEQAREATAESYYMQGLGAPGRPTGSLDHTASDERRPATCRSDW